MNRSESKKLCRRWFQQYRNLKEFKKLFHHTNVPSKYNLDPALGRWVSVQRSQYRQGVLKDYRRRALDKIGFMWDYGRQEKDRRWAEQYQTLLEFQKIHGHVQVPDENTLLYDWTLRQRQRFSVGHLEDDRRRLLDEIGFDWRNATQSTQQD